jgi:hypothetical protein
VKPSKLAMRGFDCAATCDRSTLPSNAIEFTMMRETRDVFPHRGEEAFGLIYSVHWRTRSGSTMDIFSWPEGH